MKDKKHGGLFLIILGILGSALVFTWDIIMKKPINDISGFKSIAALAICVVLIILGVMKLVRENTQSK